MARKDNKGRNLKTGEYQRPDGRYEYRYKDEITGKRNSVYAADLASLREMEKKINKDMKEGVSVPDKSYSVKDTGKYTQNQTESTAATTDQSSDPLKNAAAATEKDLDELRVTVGTGDDMTTMTYGAYLRYLELGSLGVG